MSRLTLVVFILLVVAGSAAQAWDFDLGMLFNQWVFILGPALWYLRRHRFGQRGLVRARILQPRYIPPVLVLSVCTWLLNAFLAYVLMAQLMRLGFEPVEAIPPPVTFGDFARYLLIIAVSAGVCEELLFRGAVMPAAESDGALPALMFSSLLFVLFHGSLTGFLNTAFAGLTMGVVVIKTGSILGGMLQHTVNNALAVSYLYALTRYEMEAALPEVAAGVYVLVFLLACGGFIWALRGLNRLSPVGSLLQNRERWLPAGWFNWATAVLLTISAAIMAFELLVGFAVLE
ncbi:MAG: CPBP family intramembrane glutamic endopeptidase [Bacillota bacterium]